jgi:acetyl-CoA acetyltransferase
MNVNAAIVGIGASEFGRFLPDSQLRLAAKAFKAALDDSGLEREDVDGLSIHLGWPLGLDYDRVAEGLGLNIRYVNQTWLHGRFVCSALQHAALAVSAGLANVVACVTAPSFTREREMLGGPGDLEGTREEGGTHGESPPYGFTAPAGGAALAMQRYMARYGVGPEKLAAVPMSIRKHALLNPDAFMKKELTFDDYMASRMIIDPLRLFDCCLITDGAIVTFVTTMERARDLKQKPVRIAGMQGIRSSREEFQHAPPGLGIAQQTTSGIHSRPIDVEVYESSEVQRSDVKALYTYDAFSPMVLFTLERFGFCGAGEAADFVQDGRIAPGGALPVNTNGGLLSEAHIAGWNHIREMTRQIRGTAGPRQIPDADVLQWAAVWGDSFILTRD